MTYWSTESEPTDDQVKDFILRQAQPGTPQTPGNRALLLLAFAILRLVEASENVRL